MNVTYRTQLPYSPPATQQMRADALRGLTTSVPRSQYGSQYGDVLRALGDENFAAYGKAADQANLGYAMNQQEASQDLALRGLQYLTTDAAARRQIQNSRLGLMRNAMSLYR